MSKKKNNITPKKNDLEKQKKSLEEFDVTDGKYRDDKAEQIAQARELEELLGIHEMNPYKTLNQDIFEENLESMSVSEMTDLAMHVGVTPQQNSKQLKKDLKQSFATYAKKHNVTVPSQPKPIIDQSSPDYKKTVRLFKDI
jgi:hypothetical protein